MNEYEIMNRAKELEISIALASIDSTPFVHNWKPSPANIYKTATIHTTTVNTKQRHDKETSI